MDKLIQFISTSFGIWSVFGILAIIIKICEYQFKNRTVRISFYALASLGWATYFLLKGSVVSGVANIVGIAQSLVFMQRENHKWAKSYLWLVLFIGLQIANCAIGFSAWHDVFPVLASVLGGVAYFIIDEEKYRYIALISCVFWLCNSISKVAILALVCDVSCTISGFIGLVRFYRRRKREKSLAHKEDKLEINNTISA